MTGDDEPEPESCDNGRHHRCATGTSRRIQFGRICGRMATVAGSYIDSAAESAVPAEATFGTDASIGFGQLTTGLCGAASEDPKF